MKGKKVRYMAEKKTIEVYAGEALEKVIRLMKKRLESAIRAQNDPEADSSKIIKNDELIRFAGFAASILKDQAQMAEKKQAEDENDKIEVVMQEPVLKMAK